MTIITDMVIDMDEAQVRVMDQVRQILAGTQAPEFRTASDDASRYAWIDKVLRRFDCRQLRLDEIAAVSASLSWNV